MISFRSGVSL